nr:uncharacterized protein LOC107129420 isoform X1 [Macaca fascicularis]
MQRLAPKKTRKEQSINDHPIRGPEGRLFTSQLQLKFRALSERNSWLEVSRAVTPTSEAVTSTPSTSKPRQKQTSNKLPLQERCKTNASCFSAENHQLWRRRREIRKKENPKNHPGVRARRPRAGSEKFGLCT